MADDGARERPYKYAVVWRNGDRPARSGGLELGDDELMLTAGRDALRIPLAELSSVEVGRASGDRINGQRSLVLERNFSDRVLVAALGGVGLLGEINDLLGRLREERPERASVVLVLPIRPGTADTARRLVDEGPPFDLESVGFERHHVFVSEREVVFLFEGRDAATAVEMLARSKSVLRTAVRWRGILAGKPRLARQQFGWTRPD